MKNEIIDKKIIRAKLKNRKELLRLVEDAKSNKFDRIVFWRLDRWFRNITTIIKYKKYLTHTILIGNVLTKNITLLLPMADYI